MQVISNFNQPIIKLEEHIKPILKDIYTIIKPYLTWSMSSFGIAWLITNGWCYLLIIGKGWVRAIALAYAGSYLPFTIEKPITIWIATRIQKLLFIRRKK